MWKNLVQPDSPQIAIWRMRNECWVPKAAHSEYAIIIAFPQQQWLHERASLLLSKYIACLVACIIAFFAIPLNTVL
jgi:hypothetical protein